MTTTERNPAAVLERMRLALRGEVCYGGLDLSSTTDLTAYLLVFPGIPEGRWSVLPWFWIPADTLREAAKRDRVVYDLWARQGLITPTPGAAIDYAFVRSTIADTAKDFNVQGVAYDPHNAVELVQALDRQHGLTMVECRQGFLTLSEPSKRLEVMVRRHELAHGGHPVLRWMASNAQIRHDPAGNIKPVKPHPDSPQRIDGVVALVMAVWLASRLGGQKVSVYEGGEPAPSGRRRSIYEPEGEEEEEDDG